MKIVIQHSQTRLYLKSLGRWTKEPHEALAFVDALRAMDYSIYNRVKDIRVIPIPENIGLNGGIPAHPMVHRKA